MTHWFRVYGVCSSTVPVRQGSYQHRSQVIQSSGRFRTAHFMLVLLILSLHQFNNKIVSRVLDRVNTEH